MLKLWTIADDQLADENFPLKPLSLYAKAKVAAEQHIFLKREGRLQPDNFRFATAFGLSPRMRFDLTVSEFTRELATGKGCWFSTPILGDHIVMFEISLD